MLYFVKNFIEVWRIFVNIWVLFYNIVVLFGYEDGLIFWKNLWYDGIYEDEKFFNKCKFYNFYILGNGWIIGE